MAESLSGGVRFFRREPKPAAIATVRSAGAGSFSGVCVAKRSAPGSKTHLTGNAVSSTEIVLRPPNRLRPLVGQEGRLRKEYGRGAEVVRSGG